MCGFDLGLTSTNILQDTFIKEICAELFSNPRINEEMVGQAFKYEPELGPSHREKQLR